MFMTVIMMELDVIDDLAIDGLAIDGIRAKCSALWDALHEQHSVIEI